jgi:ribosomal protein L33
MVELLSYESIRELRTSVIPQARSSVYFLFIDNEIVYVGQSRYVEERLKQHRSRIKFYYCTALDTTNMTANRRRILERLYIERFNPKYNGHTVGANILKRKKAFKSRYCVEFSWISRATVKFHISQNHVGSILSCKDCIQRFKVVC